MNDLTLMKSSFAQAAIDTVNGTCNRDIPFPSPQAAIAELESAMPAVEQLRRWLPLTALINDFIDEQPSVYALDRACRHLRRASKFMSAICEVVEAIEEQEGELAFRGFDCSSSRRRSSAASNDGLSQYRLRGDRQPLG